jgi:hypothetical protein
MAMSTPVADLENDIANRSIVLDNLNGDDDDDEDEEDADSSIVSVNLMDDGTTDATAPSTALLYNGDDADVTDADYDERNDPRLAVMERGVQQASFQCMPPHKHNVYKILMRQTELDYKEMRRRNQQQQEQQILPLNARPPKSHRRSTAPPPLPQKTRTQMPIKSTTMAQRRQRRAMDDKAGCVIC